MAFASDTRHHSLGDRIAQTGAKFVKYVAARYAHYRIYHHSLTELHGLSDASLADLGLNRSMLKSVALEAADKKVAL